MITDNQSAAIKKAYRALCWAYVSLPCDCGPIEIGRICDCAVAEVADACAVLRSRFPLECDEVDDEPLVVES